jgi:hypothetical protein
MVPGQAPVTIDRLRLRDRRYGGRGLVHELEHAAWPHTGQDEWVLIRRIQARATRSWLPEHLASEARRLAVAAVPGSSAGADAAGAVRFGSLAELLAALTVDLLRGQATRRWFWQGWARLFRLPASQAIESLWLERIAHLPSVTGHLARTGDLPWVWQQLTPAQALALKDALARHAGLGLPPPSAAPAAGGTLDVPQALRQRWFAAIASMAAADPRRWLAACLVALEWRPVLLRTGSVGLLARISLALAGQEAPVPVRTVQGMGESDVAWQDSSLTLPDRPAGRTARQDRETKRFRTAGPEAHRGPASTGSPVSSASVPDDGRSDSASPLPVSRRLPGGQPPRAGEATPAAGRSGGPCAPPESAPTAEPLYGQTSTAEGREPPQFRAAAPVAAGELSAAPTLLPPCGAADETGPDAWATPPDEAHGEATLYTEQGGLFYLINFLIRSEAQRLLEEQGALTELPDGWAWLYHLGTRLGLGPRGGLARLLALAMGLDDLEALTERPAPSTLPGLFALGAGLYGVDVLWRPSLLAVPATVSLSASHLDVVYPLSRARLDVRLAGLDVNPGWVPLLGRVVTFLYQDGPWFPNSEGV